MIEQLQLLSSQILSQKLPSYRRFLHRYIDFSQRLIGIIGARGAGKTTLLLQYLQSCDTKMLYVIADHPQVALNGLFAIADEFQKLGGECLVIDEIHKIKNFEVDLKLIYDSFFNLKVIFTGSSAMHIDNAKADLSRRAMMYKMPVLSFREFLELQTDEEFKRYDLEEILESHGQIASNILTLIKPLEHFKTYLKIGAYPFYMESKDAYTTKLLNSSMQVLQSDLPMIYAIDYDKINALKKMMSMLCVSEPNQLNISKLCGAIGLNQRTVYKYLWILQSAGLIRLLGAKSNGVSIISKPEKLFLDNTNLFSIFCSEPKIGTIRETFFASALSYSHKLNYPKSGDFILDECYVFEIGGKNKTFSQIKNTKNSFIVSDDIEIGVNKKIPLWLFGFLY